MTHKTLSFSTQEFHCFRKTFQLRIGDSGEFRDICVADYYRETKSRRLRFERYPCISGTNNKNGDVFPMELLEVMEGQRVPFNKMNPQLVSFEYLYILVYIYLRFQFQTQSMLRECQQRPSDLARVIKNEAEEVELCNSNE